MKYVTGDLIKAAQNGDVDVIAHQCNCFCNMGKGIAPLIKKAFPEAWQADLHTTRGDRTKLGTVSVGISPNQVGGCVRVYNLYGQHSYGGGVVNTDYVALRQSLKAMADRLTAGGAEDLHIGLPKIGCGHGGGDWKIVSQMIEDELGQFDVTIYTLD